MMKHTGKLIASVLLVCTFAACSDLTSPNSNFIDLDDLRGNPNRTTVINATQGLLVGIRAYVGAGANDLVGQLGILGRQSYNLDPNDPRFESEMLRGTFSPDAPAFGGNFWFEPYSNARLGNIVLTALDQLPDDPAAGGFTPAEKEWIRGFVKTINAIDFLTIVNTRDENCGCAITFPEDIAEPAPTVGKEGVFDHIVTLLEEGKGHLTATSGPAPFGFSSGFDGLPGSGVGAFNSRDGFLEFNRALRARVAVYRGDFAGALQALSESFLDTEQDFAFGVYHSFSTGSGDLTNSWFQPGSDPNLRAHPSLKADAEIGVTPDQRLLDKTRTITSRAFAGLCSPQSQFPVCDVGIDVYTSLSAPVPIIRNEELILLRAEANVGLGNPDAAEADINLVRDRAGNLPPVDLTTQAQALDQLLYEKRYSLFFEGGHRWIDMRRYGRLGELPLDLPAHVVHPAFPIPGDETRARQGQ